MHSSDRGGHRLTWTRFLTALSHHEARPAGSINIRASPVPKRSSVVQEERKSHVHQFRVEDITFEVVDIASPLVSTEYPTIIVQRT